MGPLPARLERFKPRPPQLLDGVKTADGASEVHPLQLTDRVKQKRVHESPCAVTQVGAKPVVVRQRRLKQVMERGERHLEHLGQDQHHPKVQERRSKKA